MARNRAHASDGTPLMGLCDGTHANRMMLIEVLTRRLRAPKSYCRVLQHLLDQEAHEHPVAFHAGRIGRHMQVGASERTVQRAGEFWAFRGVLAFTAQRADNGGWLSPQADLVWDAVLDQLGVKRPDSAPAGPSAACDTPAGQDSAPVRPGAFRLRGSVPRPAVESTAAASSVSVPGSVSAETPESHSNWNKARASPHSGGGGDKIEFVTTPWCQNAICHHPSQPEGSPGHGSPQRNPANVLARVRARLVNSDLMMVVKENLSSPSSESESVVARVRALANQAGHFFCPGGLWDTAEDRLVQRALYAAALLALTEFSVDWLLAAAKATAAARPRDRVRYLCTCLCNGCLNEGVGASQAELTKSWFAALMAPAERAVLPALRPLPAKPREPIDQRPKAWIELTAEDLAEEREKWEAAKAENPSKFDRVSVTPGRGAEAARSAPPNAGTLKGGPCPGGV